MIFTMIQPKHLQKGDTVAIVSTARKISKQELQPALDLLKSWGLKFVLGKSIGAEDRQFAGNDKFRAEDLQTFLDHSEIKAIWCARGGYGTVRIIDSLDFTSFLKNPKWIVGYSDITVLHNQLHKLGVQSIHAQMPLEIEKKSPASKETMRKALFGEAYDIALDGDHPLNRKGPAQGILVGGNLSILYSICGSASSLETTDKILFLEDLDEYLYHIDRMMQNLKRNGMLENLSALLVGGMSDMNDNTIPFGKTAEEIIRETVEEYDYPVYFGAPAGHVKDNRALIFGKEYLIDIKSPIKVGGQILISHKYKISNL